MQPDSPRTIPLSDLPRGGRATVHGAVGTREECELLAAMGLSRRCPLRVCRTGEPCIVQAAATRLALPADLARRILVSAEAAGAADPA